MAECYLRSLKPAWSVRSAGTSAVRGAPATENSRLAVAEIGLDLSEHRACPIGDLEDEEFDRVLVMGPEHLTAVKPWGGELLSALCGENSPVLDPYGGSLERYRETLSELRRHLDFFKEASQ